MKDQMPRKLIPGTQREFIDEYLVESQHMGIGSPLIQINPAARVGGAIGRLVIVPGRI